MTHSGFVGRYSYQTENHVIKALPFLLMLSNLKKYYRVFYISI